ncbi:hypothetical protein FB451DRAFT_1434875 [Mycena latifolia]|nr:hypothetical protein FB451DRAFT_1434875 [Mycena latifolia]
MRSYHSLIASSVSAVTATDDNGDCHQFLMECHKISTEAQFTVDSLPNAETPAVERITHQLDTIRDILLGLNDPHLSGDTLEAVIAYVTSLLSPLENFLSHPPLPARAHIPRENMCWPAKWPAKWPHMAHFTIAGRAGVSRDVSGTKFPQPALDSELVQPPRLLRGSMGREKRDRRQDTAQTDAFKFGEQSSRVFFIAGSFRAFFIIVSHGPYFPVLVTRSAVAKDARAEMGDEGREEREDSGGGRERGEESEKQAESRDSPLLPTPARAYPDPSRCMSSGVAHGDLAGERIQKRRMTSLAARGRTCCDETVWARGQACM